jgi:hypothetical protein
MPQPPASHDLHDPLAIAAYAAGDATGDQLALATGLVATCGDCAALHHDLRAIAAALPAAMPAPRPRDFRLTAEQADALRPAGWRRLLAPLAGPRFAFAGPLGTGLATLGLAGILIAGASGIPLPGSAPEDTTAGGGETAMQAPAAAASQAAAVGDDQFRQYNAAATAPTGQEGPGAIPEPTVLKDVPAASAAAVAQPLSGAGAGGNAQSGTAGASGSEASSPEVLFAAGAAASPVAEDGTTSVAEDGTTSTVAPRPAPSPSVLAASAGLLALAVGILLLTLRWTARRSA